MSAKDLSWEGHTVHTPEATWVCVESRAVPQPGTPDRIDYFMVFEARDPREGIPASRKLQLRTSSFRLATDPTFVGFLALVVDGQMLDPTSWDQFKEVYEQD